MLQITKTKLCLFMSIRVVGIGVGFLFYSTFHSTTQAFTSIRLRSAKLMCFQSSVSNVQGGRCSCPFLPEVSLDAKLR